VEVKAFFKRASAAYSDLSERVDAWNTKWIAKGAEIDARVAANKAKQEVERKEKEAAEARAAYRRTHPTLDEARAAYDRFIEENGDRTVEDCKYEIRDLINEAVGQAYQMGGKHMMDGIRRNNPDVEWR
jgi:hypothetical protein